MRTIDLKDHPNMSMTARIVREQRGAHSFDWTIYEVRGGFIITFDGPSIFDHLTFDELFATEADAIAAYEQRRHDLRAAA